MGFEGIDTGILGGMGLLIPVSSSYLLFRSSRCFISFMCLSKLLLFLLYGGGGLFVDLGPSGW